MYVTVCPEGSARRGGDAVRTCIGDGSSPSGTWSGVAPDCTGTVIIISCDTVFDSIYNFFILCFVSNNQFMYTCP